MVPAQAQQEEEEEPVLRSIETRVLQEILAGIDMYLQRVGDMDTYRERRIQCSAAALLPCSAGGEASSKANNPPPLYFLILKINLKSLQLIQRRQKMIQSTLMIHSQGIPLASNAYIFIFY
jgi:hypothetical protein